jgi:predicted transcriptional regulator
MAEKETVTLPKALVAEVREAAAAEQRGVDVLLEEAIRQYLDDRKWRTLVESGGRRAQARGLTEDDVPRLVAEARRDRQAR